MARITTVESARATKKKRSCYKCGKTIKVGDTYRWFANRIGRTSIRKNFCANCTIRSSDMTTSDNLSTLYGATEGADDALVAAIEPPLSDIAQILRDCAETVREVSEAYGESAENIVEGFGHETYQSEEIQQKSDDLESFADELESAADDIENLEDPDSDDDDLLEDFDGETDEKTGKPVDEDEAEEFLNNTRQDRREAAMGAAQDALTNCPL